MIFKSIFWVLVLLVSTGASEKIINASFDSTREVFKAINKAFIEDHQQHYAKKIKVLQSHTGSGKQARALINGVAGNVITLSSYYDMENLANHEVIHKKWQDDFPNSSSPYGSVIVFVVRKGNPKNIQDWDDLLAAAVITPNPKTSGAARWNYLAAWQYAMRKFGDEELAFNFVKKLYLNVPVSDTSARGAVITFTKRKIGDVLITWESEAFAILNEKNGDDFAIIAPSISLQINLPVAISATVFNKNQDLSYAYVDYLYSKKAQNIFALYHFRPIDMSVNQENFLKIKELVNQESLGDTQSIQNKHFAPGGLFDQIFHKYTSGE
jgi:sulfate/thiosulfate transport system substrate-binding protein